MDLPLLLLLAAAMGLPGRPALIDRLEALAAPPTGTPTWRPVPGGRFRPAWQPEPGKEWVEVAPFEIEALPVTRRRFVGFVLEYPEWRRDRVNPLFADERYLASWASPTNPGLEPLDAPVTEVSWFAAKAFCRASGGRLPTVLEWEMTAAASETTADGRDDPAWSRQITEWYARPGSTRPGPVGRGTANHFGVHDLHGLVWEWVLDFNSELVSTDSRERGNADGERFCGGGAIGANNARDYASFMRAALRGSLAPEYATRTLGFRCARSPGGAT